MKALKIRAIWFGFVAIAGTILLIVNSTLGDIDSYIAAFSSGLIVVSIMKLVQLIRISRNPMLLKKYEINQKEERYTAIAEKSGRFTMIVTLAGEGITMLILILKHQSTIATMISIVICLQILVYLATYYFFCKKY